MKEREGGSDLQPVLEVFNNTLLSYRSRFRHLYNKSVSTHQLATRKPNILLQKDAVKSLISYLSIKLILHF